MADGYSDTPSGLSVPETGSIVPDSRDALRAYLVRYAQWAVCGIGTEPEKPPCLR